ncbi:hypothetical protein BT63DRAFT_315825 [Microthyrium microscopicum]|uniref:Uncharacterized protein n=1 Tax=Microthyrium microscopicum TaxID=703497 RepID=A0A6A6U5H1_9PEZI|nr:hypothetical protein BT63DRAFT_315825 [Microthyrium microscopicum]
MYATTLLEYERLRFLSSTSIASEVIEAMTVQSASVQEVLWLTSHPMGVSPAWLSYLGFKDVNPLQVPSLTLAVLPSPPLPFQVDLTVDRLLLAISPRPWHTRSKATQPPQPRRSHWPLKHVKSTINKATTSVIVAQTPPCAKKPLRSRCKTMEMLQELQLLVQRSTSLSSRRKPMPLTRPLEERLVHTARTSPSSLLIIR